MARDDGVTTLEEISTSAEANRQFWSEHARLALFMYRHHREHEPAVSRAAKMAFRTNMKNRRERMFLELAARIEDER